jgi:putative membrane protein insertion efficiency factor
MKNLLILSIDFYKTFLSPVLHQLTGTKCACRFEITCSEYAKKAIIKHGAIKGVYLSFVRLLKCQPFYSAAETFKINEFIKQKT